MRLFMVIDLYEGVVESKKIVEDDGKSNEEIVRDYVGSCGGIDGDDIEKEVKYVMEKGKESFGDWRFKGEESMMVIIKVKNS